MAASLSMGLIGLLGGYMIPLYGYQTFFLICAWFTGLAAISFRFFMKLPRKRQRHVYE
jgi:predicted MFS family arabinose efflux permease